MWLDWLVFCDYGFSVSGLWCPLTTLTILLCFLLPWTWSISYLGHRIGYCPAATVQEQLRGATPRSRSRAAAGRSYPLPKARGRGREEQPHPWGQGPRLRGATPCPGSGGCMGAGWPRGATPCSRSGGAAVRRYPSSKIRSSRFTLYINLSQ